MNVHRESKGENVGQNYLWLQGKPFGTPAAQLPKTPPKPQKTVDARGFADSDDADYHQLHSGRKYYAQQQLTASERAAA